MPRRFTPLSVFALIALSFPLSSCLGHSTTDASQPTDTGPYAAVSTELKDSSSAPAASVLLVRAHVTHDGTALAGAPIKFTVAAGHGLLSADSTATDTLGVATVLWTLGDTATEVNTLAMVSGDGIDSLRVIAVAAGTPLSIQVRATDRPGNPVAAATVFWVASGGSLSSASSVTDANGVARVTCRSAGVRRGSGRACLTETSRR